MNPTGKGEGGAIWSWNLVNQERKQSKDLSNEEAMLENKSKH